MTPTEWTSGRWPEIISSLIGSEYADGKHHPCPKGQGKDCFRFSDVSGKGNFFCRCSDGSADGFDLIQCCLQTDFAGAAKLVEDIIGPRDRDNYLKPRKKTYAEKLLAEAVESTRSRYLESRGLNMPPGLLWHRSVDYRIDGKVTAQYPAMIAPVIRGGRFLTCHVTYLKDGRKAPVEPPRKLLPGPGLQGGAVELYPAGPRLGIAEGIETAIAASMLFDLPVWSALNTALLASWRPPEGVERVVIFGDHDRNYAGQAAAYGLAHRLHGRVDIELKFPDEPGDWNDALLSGLAAA